jgi:hypothetical protein
MGDSPSFSFHIFKKFDFSIFNPRHLKKRQTLEKVSLFGAYFSCERDEQPNFKFDIDWYVLPIYRLIPRKPDFLGRLAICDNFQLVAFLGLLGESTAACSIKVLLSGYQSIDMHYILLSAKFYGGLSISVLRNRQLFEKNEVKKSSQLFSIFKPRHLKKDRPWKKSFFF